MSKNKAKPRLDRDEKVWDLRIEVTLRQLWLVVVGVLGVVVVWKMLGMMLLVCMVLLGVGFGAFGVVFEALVKYVWKVWKGDDDEGVGIEAYEEEPGDE